MAENVTIDFKQLDKVLKNLPRTTQTKVLRPALRVGANVIRKSAEVNLRGIVGHDDSTGVGEKNIRVYNVKQTRAGQLRAVIVVKKGAVNKYKLVKGQPVRVGLYLSVLEYGKNGQPPRSWLRKAAREKSTEALNAIKVETVKRLDSAIQAAK